MAYLENEGRQAAESYVVRSFECDCQGIMRTSAVLRYFQELATLHLSLYDLPLARLKSLGVAFMLTRVRLKLLRPPMPQQAIKVTTWHRATKGVQFIRDSEMRDEDGTLLASCTAGWVLVNRETRSILRPRDLKEYTVLLQPERALEEEKAPKLALPKELEPVGTRRIRYTDIDHNGHLNNTIYADFMTDFLPCPLKGRRFSTLDLRFIAEAVEGDELLLSAAQREDTVYFSGRHARGACFEAICTLCDL